MEAASTWELLLGGAIAVLVILLFRGGIRRSLERSRQAPKDWPAVLIPLGLVVLFVILLMMLV